MLKNPKEGVKRSQQASIGERLFRVFSGVFSGVFWLCCVVGAVWGDWPHPCVLPPVFGVSACFAAASYICWVVPVCIRRLADRLVNRYIWLSPSGGVCGCGCVWVFPRRVHPSSSPSSPPPPVFPHRI